MRVLNDGWSTLSNEEKEEYVRKADDENNGRVPKELTAAERARWEKVFYNDVQKTKEMAGKITHHSS